MRLAGLTGAALGMSACRGVPFLGSGGDDVGQGGDVPSMRSLIVCKPKESSSFSLDPILAQTTGAVEMFDHLMVGLMRWGYDDGVLVVRPALAKEVAEPVAGGNGTVSYRYEIRDDAVWSDGKPVTAGDFVYAWNRAANIRNNAAFRDLFSCVAGYSNEPNQPLAVEATDDRTLSVTLQKNLPYWNELLAYTPFLPLRQDFIEQVGDYTWASDFKKCPYDGPYVIDEVAVATLESQTEMTILRKNDKFYDASRVGPQEIRFVYGKSTDEALELIKAGVPEPLSKGSAPTGVHVIYSISTAGIEKSKDIPDIQRRAVPLLGTDWFIWNVNTRLLPADSPLTGNEYELAQAEIRKAFSLLIDRATWSKQYFGYKPAATVVPPGMGDVGGSDFVANAGDGSGGYYDVSDGSFAKNSELAKEILRRYYQYDEATGRFTNFPEGITYVEPDSGGGLTPNGRFFLNACNTLGLHMNSEQQEYAQLSERLQYGDFQLSTGNWYADFTDPVTFLSLWTSTASSDLPQLGRGQHAEARIYSLDLASIGEEARLENIKWSEAYDMLIDRIGNEQDKTKRFALLHKAEDLLMSTGAVMPITHPAAAYVIRDSIQGVEASPFNRMYFGQVTEMETEEG